MPVLSFSGKVEQALFSYLNLERNEVKAELYAQMAEKVTTQLTGSWQEWAGFLTTASRLYKYPFHEQLMIYAQRPDATACAEYDLWNEKMGRYGRYSRRNKEWAKTIPNDNPETVRCGYVLNSHPAVLDGFIDLVREEQQRSRTQGEKIQPSRPSVRDKLKQELPAHKPAAPKKQGPER